MNRPIRNCNPLNIRYSAANNWQGKVVSSLKNDRDFEEFGSMRYGFLAALNLIGNTYIARYNINTPTAIISRFAPPSDGNNTNKYIADVCRLADLAGLECIPHNGKRFFSLVWAMAQIESGKEILNYRSDFDAAVENYVPARLKKMGQTCNQ